jgi:hypothetical protein
VLGEIEAVERLRRAGHAGERRGTRPLFASPRDDARPALDTRLRLRVQIGTADQAGESEGDPSRRSRERTTLGPPFVASLFRIFV